MPFSLLCMVNFQHFENLLVLDGGPLQDGELNREKQTPEHSQLVKVCRIHTNFLALETLLIVWIQCQLFLLGSEVLSLALSLVVITIEKKQVEHFAFFCQPKKAINRKKIEKFVDC